MRVAVELVTLTSSSGGEQVADQDRHDLLDHGWRRSSSGPAGFGEDRGGERSRRRQRPPDPGIVIDDQTSPTEIATAVQQAISDGVVGIVSVSPLFFLGAKYAQAAGFRSLAEPLMAASGGRSPTRTCSRLTPHRRPACRSRRAAGQIFKPNGGTVVGLTATGSHRARQTPPTHSQVVARRGPESRRAGRLVPFGSESSTLRRWRPSRQA